MLRCGDEALSRQVGGCLIPSTATAAGIVYAALSRADMNVNAKRFKIRSNEQAALASVGLQEGVQNELLDPATKYLHISMYQSG
jgi:hypothetical protein